MLATFFIPVDVSVPTAAFYGFLGGVGGLILLLLVVYSVQLLMSPYKQRNEARNALLKARENVPKKAELSIHYQVLSVYVDSSFDCRIFIKNTGTDVSRFTMVTIVFHNLDIISILDGSCQRVDELRGRLPAIQWNYAHNVIHPDPDQVFQIIDLKLKIKVANQASFIKSEIRAENMDKITDAHILHVGDLETIKSKIDKGQNAWMQQESHVR